MTKYALVGDVGGTNARLALCDVENGARRALVPPTSPTKAYLVIIVLLRLRHLNT